MNHFYCKLSEICSNSDIFFIFHTNSYIFPSMQKAVAHSVSLGCVWSHWTGNSHIITISYMSLFSCVVIFVFSNHASDITTLKINVDLPSYIKAWGVGGLGYFYVGMSGPRTPNSDPILKRICPKNDTPF